MYQEVVGVLVVDVVGSPRRHQFTEFVMADRRSDVVVDAVDEVFPVGYWRIHLLGACTNGVPRL